MLIKSFSNRSKGDVCSYREKMSFSLEIAENKQPILEINELTPFPVGGWIKLPKWRNITCSLTIQYTLPETNSEFTPENRWLGIWSFPFGMPYFQVSIRRKSKSTKLCPLVGSGILAPWIILKTNHFVWLTGLPGNIHVFFLCFIFCNFCLVF